MVPKATVCKIFYHKFLQFQLFCLDVKPALDKSFHQYMFSVVTVDFAVLDVNHKTFQASQKEQCFSARRYFLKIYVQSLNLLSSKHLENML